MTGLSSSIFRGVSNNVVVSHMMMRIRPETDVSDALMHMLTNENARGIVDDGRRQSRAAFLGLAVKYGDPASVTIPENDATRAERAILNGMISQYESTHALPSDVQLMQWAFYQKKFAEAGLPPIRVGKSERRLE